MDNQTMLPMDWRPLREAAVLAAEEVQTLYRRNDPARRDIASGVAGRSAVAMEVVAAHAALLADLRRPASRDWAARLLAKKVGMNAVNGAMVCPASVPGRFALVCGTSASEWHIFDAVHEGADGCFHGGTRVPELAGLTDGAALLRAALLAVEPA